MLDLFNFKETPKTIKIRATPKAKSTRIKAQQNPDGSTLYKVYVTAAPENGKANKAIIELIAKELGLAKSKLSVKSGHTSKDKVISVQWD